MGAQAAGFPAGTRTGKTDARSPVRAVFLDLDGTLVSKQDHTIPESARHALHAAVARGVLLFSATGRHASHLNRSGWMDEFEFAGHVTLNGQYCYRTDGVPVHRRPIPRECIASLLRRLEETPYPCYFLEEEHGYLNFVDQTVKDTHADIGSPLPEVGDVRRALEGDVYQIVVYAPPVQAVSLLRGLEGCDFTQWHSLGFDLTPAGGDKWIGIRRMLEEFSLRPDEIAAVGDGANDLEMLRRAGWSVAMGGASGTVKAAADFVTREVEEDGILYAFRNYLRIA